MLQTRTVVRAVALAATIALLTACGDSQGSGNAPLPIFDGVGDFYDVPAPLPPGEPGDLIRVEPVTLRGNDDRGAMRVMYHTRDSHGRDIAATGVITYPLATAPDGGWPVLSYGHGTSGLAPRCAPSRGASSPPRFGVDGVVVAADYPGLGPNGQRHAYLAGRSEGHSVIDMVRAARHVADAGAGKRWVALGVSQGGHAVLFADELASSYAPDLELLGTVAVAPGSSLDQVFPDDAPSLIATVTTMALFGIAEEFEQIDPADYATPALLAASSVLDTGCITEIGLALAVLPFDQFFVADPRLTEPARSVMFENDPGRRATSGPLLLVQGTADVVVVPARTDALLDKLCALGAVVDLELLPGAGHDNAAVRASEGVILPWIAARFAGEAAPSVCGEVAAP
jgi:dienelactone hydrolase